MRFAFLLLALLFAGCDLLGSEAGSLDLRTDQPAYDVGADVAVTLANDSPRRYEMGPLSCAGLQRREGGAWEGVDPDPDVACAAILISLAPGGREEAVRRLDADLPAGTYRYAHRVSRDVAEDPDGLTVYSNAFEVQ